MIVPERETILFLQFVKEPYVETRPFLKCAVRFTLGVENTAI